MTSRADDLIETMRNELFTAVVGDVLDTLGHKSQFLAPGVAPLTAGTVLIGRAMPVLEADHTGAGGSGPLADKPFGLLFDALDDLKAGEVYLASGGRTDYALFGGLMARRAQHLRAAGAVLDGYVRDAAEIGALGFPVFSRGLYAQDQAARGKVIDYRVPVRLGAVSITPGDLVFADDEGVLIIPQGVEREAIEAALEKVRTENKVAEAIAQGMSAREAFATFGVL